ncbi:Ceramide glucosyltransferase [Minicystis rosea]|nr:Ceramide glucosyltransferase [Minicystis rosea]
MIAGTLGAVTLGWALAVGSIELEAVRRFVCRRRPAPITDRARAARVLLIRPCAGHDPWLDEALSSLTRARRSALFTCRIAIADVDDAAHPTGIRAAQTLTDAGIESAVVLTAPGAPNRKAAQLAAVVAREEQPFDVIMVADGDVDLTAADLDAFIDPLVSRADIGAVWAPPVEMGHASALGDRASAALLGASLHAFPLLARLDRRSLVGKLFAVRRDALEAAGGFEALTMHLGEDMELARRLGAARFAVAAAPVVARSLAHGRTWAQAEARFGRWLQVIRAQRPLLLASYPLLFFATFPILVLSALTALTAPAIASWAALYAITMRLAVAYAATVAAGRPRSFARLVGDAILADVLLAGAFVRALRSRRVVWRDVSLTIDRGGQLRLLEEKGG